MTADVIDRTAGVDVPPQRIVMVRAKDMVVGLFVTNGEEDASGRFTEAPLKILAIEPYHDGRLLFTFDNGWRMPWAPAARMAMQCIPVECPPWCVEHSVDSSGITYHGSEAFEVSAAEGSEVMSVNAYRYDDPDGTTEPAAICLGFGTALIGDAMDAITPAQARALGELLIHTANLLEGISK